MSWARVNQVLHRVLSAPPHKRAAILTDEAGDDAALRAEVESLLAAHEADPEFLSQPILASTAVAAAHAAELPETIGPYRIDRVLGEGGMGVVYLATDSRLGRTVALKAVAPEFAGDALRRERLRREARAAAALTHPGVATVYALEEIDGELYIASEYVPGRTLRDELNDGPASPEDAVATTLAIARPLVAAHDLGLVHRDLKPENIIRTPTGELKLLDFGLARMTGVGDARPRLTLEGAALGTPAYMSPEQFLGQEVDSRTDVFSLGVILHELITGETPFAGRSVPTTFARVLAAEPRRLQAYPRVAAEAAAHIDPILEACLAKAPAARYTSARQLVAALEQARDALASGALHPRAGPSVRVRSSRWWWQFHQAITSVAYLALLLPLWLERDWIGQLGLVLFFGALITVLVASGLRLHLWFALRTYPAEWASQRASTTSWIRMSDAALVTLLVVIVILTGPAHPKAGTLLVAAAVVVALSSAVIEPATTRAAFGPGRLHPPAPE